MHKMRERKQRSILFKANEIVKEETAISTHASTPLEKDLPSFLSR